MLRAANYFETLELRGALNLDQFSEQYPLGAEQ